jgi:3',5'-cyclic AMP phosphodiesterase CpdA
MTTLLGLLFITTWAGAQGSAAQPAWTFAISGDSRNCGDVVMPAIAKKVAAQKAAFYWHLGDLRATYKIDEDISRRRDPKFSKLKKKEYVEMEWDDFIDQEIKPFGSLPVYLGIGNHECVPPKSREQFVSAFASWLDAPVLKDQRLLDDPHDHQAGTYYHWIDRGVDFIYLDNATPDQLDDFQLKWLEQVLTRDEASAQIKTVVVGMHEALPQSLSASHSMNQSEQGTKSGLTVYADLLKARDQAHKNVYVLASHSHFFMDGIFNTKYWKENGGILPGWIVGTAGAIRYKLPAHSEDAAQAQTKVYGYLLGKVDASGKIQFDFQPLSEADVPADVAGQYEDGFVHWCFAENAE